MSDIDINQVLSQMRSMSIAAQGSPAAPTEQTTSAGADFSAMLSKYVDGVNSTQKEASAMSEAFATESADVDLTEVMIALQKASVSFQAMTEVRNKLVSAYQEIMNMQV